jgi:hypothetical protein
MEEISKSLLFGTKSFHGKVKLQSYCCSLFSPDQLEHVLSLLSKDTKLSNVTDKILAFRTENEEGYDDGSLIGAGEKLLHMLERMNADNLVLIVFLWDYGHIGRQGTEIFKVILDSARDLLLTLHSKSFDLKTNERKKILNSTNFNSEVIPAVRKPEPRASVRPRHFLADRPGVIQTQSTDDPGVSESELYNAVNQVETSLRALSQSDIIELRSSSTNPLVLKVLQMVCILKGYNASTWNNIKEMLDSRTFKIELGMIDVYKISKRQAQTVRNLLKENQKLTSENLTRVSLPAATLLSWVLGVMTWYSGRNIVKPAPPEALDIKKNSQISVNWPQSKGRTSAPINEEPEEELITVKKLKTSPELEDKLRKTRELKVEYEERIERILKTRLDEVNFEGERVELNDEDIINYLGTQTLQQHPTSVLLALVGKLKERRLAETAVV